MCKKKELIIVSDFGMMNGGAAKIALSNALLFSKQPGYKVSFLCGQVTAEYRRLMESSNIQVVSLDVSSKYRIIQILNYFFNVSVFLKLRRFFNGFDKSQKLIVHVHTYVNLLSSSVFLSFLNKNISVFFTAHDYFSICPNGAHFNYVDNRVCKYKGNSIDCLLTSCDKRNFLQGIMRRIRFFIEKLIMKFVKVNFLSISQVSCEKINSYGYENTIVLNPVDFNSDNDGKSFSERKGLLYIGRLDQEKGFHLLADICNKFNIPLNVIGDVEGKMILNYDCIEYLGWCDSDMINVYIDHSLAVVMPSLWSESFGLVALEAASRGTPCILTDISGASSYFDKAYDKLILKVSDLEGLNDLYSFLSVEKEWAFYSKLAKASYVSYENLSKNYVERLSEIYEV